jgi:hypothetical protein
MWPLLVVAVVVSCHVFAAAGGNRSLLLSLSVVGVIVACRCCWG